MYSLATQSSSRNIVAERSGELKTFVSQNQTPIEYRFAKKSLPTSPANVVRSSALRQMTFVS